MVPEKQRAFALEVVKTLRSAGFDSLFTGGCVRDVLLGRTPNDFDVATNATPGQIRKAFGHRRTLAIGAAFGVITVVGPRGAGQIEVATFRRDAAYSDGRHPDSVTFSDAREDALRRDFTINGLFYDPVENRVIDYVGGQEDLRQRLIRAIGDPDERFNEDKLRMLRAVRFAAAFEFHLEQRTQEAIQRRAGEILAVSPERIAQEMRRILEDAHRALGMRLLVQTGLDKVILPELAAPHPDALREVEGSRTTRSGPLPWEGWQRSLAVIEQLRQPGFPLVLAAILHPDVNAGGARSLGLRWRLSNEETGRLAWLVEHRGDLQEARNKRWSRLQPLLVADGIADLIALTEAERRVDGGDLEEIAWLRSQLARPRQELDPPPLVSGDDLIRHGVPRGPIYRILLDRIRQAQLDGELHSQQEALDLVDRLREVFPP